MRATAFRKLRGSTNDLSEYELLVLEQQIRADFDRIDGNGTANASSHTAGTTTYDCHDGHESMAPAGTPTTGSTAVEFEGASKVLMTTGSRSNPNRSEVLDPRILHKCNPSTGNERHGRASSFSGEPASSHRTRSTASSWKNRRPHHGSPQRSTWTPENEELSVQLHFALVLVMPRESVGELIVRNVNQGEGAVAWRQLLGEYASTEPGNVLAMWSKLGDLRFPQGSDIVVGINKMEENMARYQKMAGETLSDTIKRGILMKALTNEAELQKRVFRNSTRLSTYEKMREEVMSVLTAESGQCTSRWGTILWRSGPFGKSGTKGEGKNDQKGRGKGPGQGKGLGIQNSNADRECFYCHQKGHVKKDCRFRIADVTEAKSRDERDKKKEKRFRQKEKKKGGCDGRSRTCGPRSELQERQPRRGSGHCRRECRRA